MSRCRMGIGGLVVEESAIESKSASIHTSLITEANSMDSHRVGTNLTPLESWEGAEHAPVDRIEIGGLAGEGSHFEDYDRQDLARLPRHFLF